MSLRIKVLVRTVVLLSLALLVAPSPGAAQEEAAPSWVVVVATTNPADTERTAGSMLNASAVLQSAGNQVVEPAQAASTAEAEISQPFEPAPEGLDERVGQVAESVLEMVAFGDNENALARAEPVLAELDSHLAALGRNDRSAVDILNLCLYIARARLQLDQAAEARRQVHVCARLVPDLPVDERVHPPQIRNLVSEVRNEIEGSSSVLAIQAAPSDPGSCIIRVNGRRLGTAGGVRRALPPGSYAVQAECDPARAGRLHPVVVAEGAPTRLVVNAQLSERLDTRPVLSLTYRSSVELQASVAGDVARLANTVGANHVLAAVDDGRSLVFRTYVVRAGGARVARTQAQPRPLVLNEAVLTGLIGGPDDPAPSSGPNGASIALGATFVTLGVGGLVTGWIFWADLEAAWTDLRVRAINQPGYGALDARAQNAKWAVLASGLGGSALLTLGIPFLLADEDGTPWWSWVLGGLGLAAIGTGIAVMATEGYSIVYATTPPAPYTQRTEPAFLGSLILAHGVPLVAVPLTHLIREATKGATTASASVHFGDESFGIDIQGTF